MITLYTSPNSVQCEATKRSFQALGIDFREIDLHEHPEAEAEIKNYTPTLPPVVDVTIKGLERRWSGFQPDQIKKLAAVVPLRLDHELRDMLGIARAGNYEPKIEWNNYPLTASWAANDYTDTFNYEILSDGIAQYANGDNRSVWVTGELNQQIPASLRNEDGWYSHRKHEQHIPLFIYAAEIGTRASSIANTVRTTAEQIAFYLPDKWQAFTDEYPQVKRLLDPKTVQVKAAEAPAPEKTAKTTQPPHGDVDTSPRKGYSRKRKPVITGGEQMAFSFDGLFAVSAERQSDDVSRSDRAGRSNVGSDQGRARGTGRRATADVGSAARGGAGRDVRRDGTENDDAADDRQGVRNSGVERDHGGGDAGSGLAVLDGVVRDVSPVRSDAGRTDGQLGDLPAREGHSSAPVLDGRPVDSDRRGVGDARATGTGVLGGRSRGDRRGEVRADRGGRPALPATGSDGVVPGLAAEVLPLFEGEQLLEGGGESLQGLLGDGGDGRRYRRGDDVSADAGDTDSGGRPARELHVSPSRPRSGAGVRAESGDRIQQPLLLSPAGSLASGMGRGEPGGGEDVQNLGDDRGAESGVFVAPTRTRVDSPSGFASRVDANIAAIETMQAVTDRPTTDQQRILAQWSGWGGLSRVFDDRVTDTATAGRREKLEGLLSDSELAQARRGVLNAHYTSPAYSQAIWNALTSAGVDSGRGLEPGCGAGTFISSAPAQMAMTGIELDSTTARIAQLLNPDDEIRAEGFQDTQLPTVFDVAVGNVPFGDIRLHDRAHNPGHHTIHNHFIIKSLDLVKPGGYVAVLTSSFTMDAQNPGARRDMYERADLVAAIRLPSGAHQSTAGTEVVTDLLVLRKRGEGETPGSDEWTMSVPYDLPDKDGTLHAHRMNAYWRDNPQNVLGDLSLGSGMYGAHTLTVTGSRDSELAGELEEALTAALSSTELRYEPIDVMQVPDVKVELDKPVGTLRATETGGERLTASGTWEAIRVAKKHVGEFHALLDLMDYGKALVALESVERNMTPQLEELRRQTRQRYESYTDKYGPVNRNEKRVSIRKKKDAAGNVEEVETIRIIYPPAVTAVRKDPRYAVLFGLEKFNDDTGVGKPADILLSRQIFARYTPKGADSLDDALHLSVENRMEIDTAYIAYMLGRDDDPTADLLDAGLVFEAPDGSGLVLAEEYLSGNVRKKLDAAEAAALSDPKFERNCTALREVLPPDIPREQIATVIGAQWIDVKDYEAFLRHLLGEWSPEVARVGLTEYSVTLNGAPIGSFRQTSVWGTERMRASDIFKKMLCSTPLKVEDTEEDGTKVYNPAASEAVKVKGEEIQNEFTRWIWSDSERADRLFDRYQRQFNSLVGRDYSKAGQRLVLPGLAKSFTLYPHQKAAVARMISEPTAGLFHEVGAGKTLEMACGVMEMKRLGLINKPMAVVPNHLVGQFENEWLQAYPAARVLTIDTTEVSKPEARAKFFAQATTSDWDIIIASQTAFEKIPVFKATLTMQSQREVDRLHALLAYLQTTGDKKSVAKTEEKLAQAESNIAEALAKVADKQDADALTFEQLGVDYLVVDEAHHYKNLGVQAGQKSSELTASQANRAKDMDVKISWLRENVSQRCVTFATATPVANSMGEMYVMTHYLRPDLLRDAGVEMFEAWVNQFAVKEANLEINVAGKPAVKERFTRFQNLPELLSMWNTFADVKLSEDLDYLKVPQLVERAGDGQRRPVTVTVDLGQTMEEFQARLDERAGALSAGVVNPSEDNWLALGDDGNTFALDDRLFSADRADRALGEIDTCDIPQRKVDAVARQVLEVYSRTKDNVYVNDDGEDAPTPGGLQIVFCDRGVPKKNEFSLYTELRELLVQGGIPREKIAFIHDAKNRVERTQMFLRARAGAISVLIGSTEKMGTGANMQTRAVAIHHVDVPWRPADVTQRDGRIIRQKNQNAEVESYRYVTLRSLDSFRWQTVERKGRFISQIMRGKFDGREVEDVSQDILDYAETKAIATGDPLLMKQVELKNTVARLARLDSAFEANQNYNVNRIGHLENQLRDLKQLRHAVDKALDTYTGKDLMLVVDYPNEIRSIVQQSFTDRVQAAQFLSQLSHRLINGHSPLGSRDFVGLRMWPPKDFNVQLTVNGVALYSSVLHVKGSDPALVLTPKAFSHHQRLDFSRSSNPWNQAVTIPLSELRNPTHHTIGRIENLVNNLEHRVDKSLARIDKLEEEIEQARGYERQRSPYRDDLTDAKDALKQVNNELARREKTGVAQHQLRLGR